MMFVLGLFVGASIGAFGMALACAAGRKHERMAEDITRNL